MVDSTPLITSATISFSPRNAVSPAYQPNADFLNSTPHKIQTPHAMPNQFSSDIYSFQSPVRVSNFQTFRSAQGSQTDSSNLKRLIESSKS